MSYFATIPDTGQPLRLALVGAGAMGRVWAQIIAEMPSVRLVAVVDLEIALATHAVQSLGIAGAVVGTSVTDVASAVQVDAVLNVTVPGSHFAVTRESLQLGLPVLCEKPIVPTVEQAVELAAMAETTGRLLMTSQSRRYYRTLFEFGDAVSGLGDVGLLTTEFHTGPHFGGFRDEMDHPLLLDMAIHAFDAARFVLGAEPVSVFCDAFNPPWSWYRGDASAVAIFEMSGGARYVFTGSWCSRGLDTSWNGSWVARGRQGAASWDGSSAPVIDPASDLPALPERSGAPEEMAGALTEFVASLRSGEVPYGDIHSNVWSLAMVQAAVASADSGRKVDVALLVEDARRAAMIQATAVDASRLEAWGSAADGLDRYRP